MSEQAARFVQFEEPDPVGYLEQVRPYVDGILDRLIDASHRIHERPEIRFEESFASALLADELEREGFTVERGIAGLPTAFAATGPRATGDGPSIAIFCEYDALEGLGHGCGHNIIGSAGLGASIAVKRWLDDHPEVPGRLTVLGSPGEEGGGGKVFLIDAGYLEGIDAAMMIHPSGKDRASRGSLSRVAITVSFEGKAAHASGKPYDGINALDAANLMMVAIGLLRQQIRPESRVHGIIVDGGQAPNIIPERTELWFYVRSPSSGYLRKRLVPAVENCAKGAALATGASVKIETGGPTYENMLNNDVLTRLTETNLRALGRPSDPASEDGLGGSTDMGNVSQVVPAIHPYMKLTPGLAMHTREAAEAAASPEGDRVVVDGALLLAMTAVELYSEPRLVDAAAASFRSQLEAAAHD